MDPENISAISTTVAALAAIAAVAVSYVVYRGQSNLSKNIADSQATLSAKIASDQSAISLSIHQEQTRLSQRQLLLPLWQYMSSLSLIDPRAPITPDVLKVVNTLELVAISCEGGMVDKDVIKRTFSDLYLQLYDQVEAVDSVPGRNASGKDLLRENRAAMAFYEELKKEHTGRGQLHP